MSRHTPEDLERIAKKAEADDREWEEVLGRARAKAAGVPFDPAVHRPDAKRRRIEERVPKEFDGRLKALCGRWTAGEVPRRRLGRAG